MAFLRTSLLSILLTGMILAQGTGGETERDLSKYWTRLTLDQNFATAAGDNSFIYVPAPNINRYVRVTGAEATLYPNFRPFPTTNSTQSELSIDVHPLNMNILLLSANSTSWSGSSVGTLYGTGTYLTTNGGTNWQGWDDPPYGRNSGDPVSVIAPNGYMHVGYIHNSGGQGVATSSNNGVNWTTSQAGANPSSSADLLDKNHMTADKVPGSPYANRLYDAWTAFLTGSPNNNNIELVYSSNNGTSWSTPKNISGNLNAGSHCQGVNLSTGPNGEVYATFAVYDQWGAGVYGEDAIGFAKSTDGGVTWTPATKAYQAANFGIRGNLKPTSIRVSSFPSMAVDRSNGPGRGNIYIVWPQKGVAPAGSDPDIVMIKSTDGGTTWSTPVRVNNDPINNARDQYYPWATVDQTTGHVYSVWYDSRDMSNDSATVYMGRSMDFGSTFENIKISDSKFKPKAISGLAGGYQGDYIGIAAKDNTVWAYWADDRTNVYQGWVGKATFGPTINHTALGNTENLAGPYVVNAVIESTIPLAANGVKVYWGRGTGGEITDSLIMTNPSGNNWTASIPGNGQPATYNYYIKAEDNTGGVSTFPAGAPSNKLSFVVATDTEAPVITHSVIGDQYRETWPVTLNATITDNIGIDSAYVVYKINTAGTMRRFNLTAGTGNAYSGAFNVDTSLIALGDTLYYRIVAKDAGAAHTAGYHPSSTTFNSFKFVPDNTLPVVNHTPLRDVAKVRWPAKVSASATDNLGIYSVTVLYTKNNGAPNQFTLTNTSGSLYEGFFNLDSTQIAVGDSIQYRIKVVDNSTNRNTVYFPASGTSQFKVINTLGVVLVLDDDVVMAERSTASKGKGDEITPLGASGNIISTTLTSEGYLVDKINFASLDTTTLNNYDVVILSSGAKTGTMFDDLAKRTAIVNYTLRGGKTLVEGGEVGWIYRYSSATSDKDPYFRTNVLQCSSWVSDMSGTGLLRKIVPGHQMFTIPNLISDSLAFTGTSYGDRDAMRIIAGKSGIYKIGGWYPTYLDTAGIILYSPNNNPANIRNVFFTFSLGTMVNQTMAAKLIVNTMNFMMSGGSNIPVELTSFNANADANSVLLTWTTATELNNQGFSVERKKEGGSYTSAGFIAGRGNTLEPSAYSFVDKSLESGKYTYRLKQVDFDGTFKYSNEVEVEVGSPSVFALEQNYPNPFNPSTVIKYSIPVDGFVNLTIYNTIGEKIKTIVSSVQKAGSYEVSFDASKLASGVYIYRLESGSFSSVKKMILNK
ncbi:MAG: T9SS type A sorting domain-containing protein [Ignavibacteria bacterium]|nr:T9SS type A sorting domain-containing protein [Ignavibacteria bacterium]